MSATSVRFTYHLGFEDRPFAHRLRADEIGRVQLSIDEDSEGSFCLYGDPADVLHHLDALRQLVIDHLVETVGIPADPTGELLADILREVGPDLPSPLSHRIRSTIAGDQPTPTGRTAAAALTERTTPDEDALTVECLTCHGAGYLTEQHDYASEQLGCQDCEGAGRIAAWLADPCPADPDGQHFVGCGCDAAYADRSPVAAGGAS